MSSTTLLFPGQGSQYVGMGSKWIQKYPYAKQIFDRADEALGFSLSDICFNGPEEKLVKTEYTQPAILTTSIAMFEILKKERNISFDYTAGHSLGEYSALVASGALSLEDAVKIVNIRGKLMQKAVPAGLGKMAAVRKCEESVLLEEINNITLNDPSKVLVPANFNSDDQIVVSGSADAVDLLLSNLKFKKIRGLALNVSAPFHSPMMQKMVPEFSNFLNKLSIGSLRIPYVANINAEIIKDSSLIIPNLTDQISGSVMWTQSIKTLLKAGVSKSIEVGPGKVLSGLCAKIEGSFECLSLDTLETVESL